MADLMFVMSIASALDDIVRHADRIWAFINGGWWADFSSAMAWLWRMGILAYWEIKIASVGLAWGVAKNVMEVYHLASYVQGAFLSFDQETMQLMYWFRVPDFVNTLITAYITRYVMSTTASFLGMVM